MSAPAHRFGAAALLLALAACGAPAASDGAAAAADAAADAPPLGTDAASPDADAAAPADAPADAAPHAADADAASDAAAPDAADADAGEDAPAADADTVDATVDAASDAVAVDTVADAADAADVDAAAADAADAAVDAATDGASGQDAAADAATDADAGTDASADAATDADAGADAAADTAPDDAALADATDIADADASPDSGSPDSGDTGAGSDDTGPDGGTDAALDSDTGSDSAGDSGGTCTWFAPCVPANACHNGHWICPSTGASCVDLGTPLSDGASCGSGGTCVSGSCQICGAACTPNTNPCHTGTLVCSGGGAQCVDSGGNVPDLTPCWGAFLCTGGNCAPCSDFAPCMPANPCHTGYLTCGGGLASSCVDTAQPASDGIACGNDQSCSAGLCAALPYKLILVSGGGQSAFVDADVAQPIVLRLQDAGGAPLANAPVTLLAPEGAIATPVTAKTDASGKVSFALRLNLKVNPAVAFAASGPGGASLTVTVAATAPPADTIFAVVGRDGPNVEAMSGVGTQSIVDATRGLAISSSGTLYFGEAANGGFGNCYLKTLSPLGELATLAGTGKCGFGGDGGLASAGQFTTITDIALDEAKQRLYFVDSGNDRVRQIDLASGILTTLAGGGTTTDAAWGDEGPAVAAVLKAPTRLSLGPAPLPATGSALYISDDGHGSLRWIDSGGIIHTLLAPQTGDCAKDDLLFVGCTVGCDVAFGQDGEQFITGAACGASTGTPENGLWADAIFRRAADGTLTRIAGVYAYDTGDGTPANTSFVQADLLALDAGGNLFFAGYQAQQVRRIDGRSGLVTTIAGGIGQYGTSGSYVPGPQAKLILPVGLALSADNNLYFTDGNQLRVLWGVGHPAPSDVKLIDGSDPLAPAPLDAPFTGARARVVQAPNAQPVPGVAVHWQAMQPGAGVRQPVYLTDVQGNSTPAGRVGLVAQTYTLRATAQDIHTNPLPGSPVDLLVEATPVAAGTIFSVFAVDPVAALEGAATLAKTSATAVAASADGTLYVAATCGIFAVRMPGTAQLVAGDGVTCAFNDGGGVASKARFSPLNLALDDSKHLLYISDFVAARVYRVDLQSGGFSTVAGGGSASTKPWGDGGQASDATLQTPRAIALGNGGLYIADTGRNQIRFVASSGVISTLPIAQADCFFGTGCTAAVPGICWTRDLAWDDANGQLLISAAACGPVAGDASAILAIKPGDSQVSWFAGATLGTGSSADGTPMLGAEFGMYADSLSIGFDPSGILHALVSYSYDVRLRKIVDGKVYTVAGVQNPQPGAAMGDYGPLSQAQFDYPSEFTFVPPGGLGKLAVIDNGVLRLVW